MWKKEDEAGQSTSPRPDGAKTPERAATVKRTGESATIGRSISIRGDVTGDEDLLIQGRVEGSVDLKEHAVTVGPDGTVKASIIGRVVTVQGKVEGDLSADEQIVLRSSASVQGDITAPRVVLEDGARFRGGIDMGDPADRKRASDIAPRQERKTPEPSRESSQPDASAQAEKSPSEKSSDSKVKVGA